MAKRKSRVVALKKSATAKVGPFVPGEQYRVTYSNGNAAICEGHVLAANPALVADVVRAEKVERPE